MSYSICDYEFEGPYNQTSEIIDQRGAFVVLCQVGGEWRILDVDSANYLRTDIERHPRAHKWRDRCYGTVSYACYYSGSRSMDEIEEIIEEIITEVHPPCRG